jgi:hypothetical protein
LIYYVSSRSLYSLLQTPNLFISTEQKYAYSTLLLGVLQRKRWADKVQRAEALNSGEKNSGPFLAPLGLKLPQIMVLNLFLLKLEAVAVLAVYTKVRV